MPSRLTQYGFVESLYRNNESDLKSFVRRRIGVEGPIDVDDIVQEAFVRIAAQRDVDRLSNPRGFLFRIARNLIFDTLRRNRVRRRHSQAESVDAARNDDSRGVCSAEAEASCQQDLDLVLEAIDRLPEQCRRVFLMQRREGLSYARIADRLGISESMVQKHMSKALARLHEVLP